MPNVPNPYYPGLKKVLHAAPDETGGMAQRISGLPPFWQKMANGNIYQAANCSPELVVIAKRLFHPMSILKVNR
jgi:hypothetical protein